MNLEGVTKKIEGTTILEDVTFSLRKKKRNRWLDWAQRLWKNHAFPYTLRTVRFRRRRNHD